jgi:hypothetical protein
VKGYWDNLRPLEKRMVVGVATMFFVILNAWFVFPHFSDWGRVQQRMAKARNLLNRYESEIKQMPFYEGQIRKLQGHESQPIALEDQAGHFADEIRSLATGIRIDSFPKIASRTNDAFFWEQIAAIGVSGKEQQLVDFLYNLGVGDSLVRVRDLTLRPVMPARQELSAGVKLVASYQKKAALKAAGPAAPPTGAQPPTAGPSAPATRPATTTTKSAVQTNKQPASGTKPIVPPGKPATNTNKPPSTTKRT